MHFAVVFRQPGQGFRSAQVVYRDPLFGHRRPSPARHFKVASRSGGATVPAQGTDVSVDARMKHLDELGVLIHSQYRCCERLCHVVDDLWTHFLQLAPYLRHELAHLLITVRESWCGQDMETSLLPAA